MYVLISNYENRRNLFKSKRADIIIKKNDSITAIELTFPFELNIINPFLSMAYIFT